MSLNGLDAPAVQEAYQQTVAEAGGWFLLKYVTRDSVELLGRGSGGVHEARTAISNYEEASPLYGLIIYRRRKVLIKYIPAGTTRLLQARTAVHFQDVAERYSPYETLLEITTGEGLNDTSLASSFPLHTASPSNSSSRLHEISEDGEDNGPAPRRPANQTSATGSIFGTQRYKMEKRVDQVMGPDHTPRRPTPSIQITSDSMSTLSSPLSSPQKTSISQFLVREDSGQRSITSLGSPPSIATVADYADSDASGKSAEETRGPSEQPASQLQPAPQQQSKPSSQTAQPSFTERPSHTLSYTAERLNNALPDRSVERPNTQERPSMSESGKYDDEPYDFSRFDTKPKVKLGPRPVAATERMKQPTVASISAVPASYRPTQKRPELSRPKSHGPVSVSGHVAALPVLPKPPPIPDAPEYNPRPVSRGSVKSAPSHKSTGMTPDKIRLMKAVELRKRQLRKSNPQQSTFVPSKDQVVPAVPKIQENQRPESQSRGAQKPSPDMHADEEHASTKKPDSGIEMGYAKPERQDEDSRADVPMDDIKQPSADPATLAQLKLFPSPGRKSLRLDTSRPPSLEKPSSSEPMAEPTMSLDMLDDPPNPVPSRLLNLQSNDSPTLGRSIGDPDTTTPPRQYVPTILMADGSRLMSPNERRRRPMQETAHELDQESKCASDDVSSSGAVVSPAQSLRKNEGDLAKRRRGIVEPLHIDPHAEGDSGSDDEFLEELRSATLQEAKPMTVARSPMAPSFARRPSAQSVVSNRSIQSVKSVNIRRSSSNLLDHFTDSPDGMSPDLDHPAPARSQSVTTSPTERGDDPMPGIKRNVSSGLARRIHALTEASGEPSPTGASRPLTPETSPQSNWRERKSSVRSQPRTSSFKAVARHSGRLSGYSASNITPGSNGIQQPEPVWNVQHDPVSNRDSVSVTARIVRPTHGTEIEDAAPDGPLQQSQLVINHKRTASSTTAYNKALPPLDTNPNPPARKSESAPSMTNSPVVTQASSEYRVMHSANRKSFGRHRQAMSPLSPSAEDFPAPPSHMAMPASRVSVASSNEEAAAPREGTRTSRFFKRMSNLGGGHKRRNSGQQFTSGPSATDAASVVQRNHSIAQSEIPDMPPAVVVGDLNVQFPDSLLWKRRIVEIDDAGYLTFSIPQAMDIQKGAAKKFHVSEFRMPYAPDLDRQELAHSVMLDFVDGQTTLQAACEDGMTHRQVLHVLRSYWKAWDGGA